ncbi:MAG: hypothetical protein ACR2P3_15175 [Geminicoccaceae bacterium]
MPEPRATIERDKIKHRRPNDLIFDDAEPPATRHPAPNEEVDEGAYYGDAEPDWTDQEEQAPDAQVWDDEPEEDWTLAGEDEPHSPIVEDDVYIEDAYAGDEDEGGVVWEDDGISPPGPGGGPDEVAFGRQNDKGMVAPEVELAGRRDVRPKPPKPPAPPGTRAPRQPEGRSQQRPQQRGQPRNRPQPPEDQVEWHSRATPAAHELPGDEASFEPRQRPAAHPTSPPVDSSRFSRTQAMLGVSADAFGRGSDEQVLQQPMRGPAQRRRQAQPAPATGKNRPRRHVRHGRGRGRTLVAVLVLTVLALGGWLAFQPTGLDGIRPIIDRLATILPLPGTTRTAGDTSFGDPATASTEQALSDLKQRIQQQEGGAQSTARPDGPPIPKFKPLPGATRSLSSAAATDEAQLAANDSGTGDDEAGKPTIFQQLWRYINPG